MPLPVVPVLVLVVLLLVPLVLLVLLLVLLLLLLLVLVLVLVLLVLVLVTVAVVPVQLPAKHLPRLTCNGPVAPAVPAAGLLRGLEQRAAVPPPPMTRPCTSCLSSPSPR